MERNVVPEVEKKMYRNMCVHNSRTVTTQVSINAQVNVPRWGILLPLPIVQHYFSCVRCVLFLFLFVVYNHAP